MVFTIDPGAFIAPNAPIHIEDTVLVTETASRASTGSRASSSSSETTDHSKEPWMTEFRGSYTVMVTPFTEDGGAIDMRRSSASSTGRSTSAFRASSCSAPPANS